MRIKRKLIERYILAAVLPYFGLALFFLTAILLIQQANRFAETLGSNALSLWSALEVTAGLLPGVLVFSVPMAALMGGAIGVSRMSSDSELIAAHAAGIGRGRCLVPVLILGGGLTVITLFIGMELIPDALRLIKKAALRAAAHRLESPIDLREFNVSIPGKVIYVRDGDKIGGEWGRIFINWSEGDNSLRLITSRSGRIDSSMAGQSELVLTDAVVTTINAQPSVSKKQIISEHANILRIKDSQLNDSRNSIVERLQSEQLDIDEQSWKSVLSYIKTTRDPKEKIKASLTLHKRLALCVAPLVFTVLGALIGMRNRRGGKGLGVMLAVTAMMIYYLVALAGEQLAKIEVLPPAGGAWLATFMAIVAILLLLVSGSGYEFIRKHHTKIKSFAFQRNEVDFPSCPTNANRRFNAFGALINRKLLKSLFKNFVFSSLSLIGVFYIFTLFELIRFINSNEKNIEAITEYLVYLMPFAAVTLAPMSALVSVLITYALLARRSESIAWWACGRSTYRLAVPGIFFAILIGGGVWVTQEQIMPRANIRQETLRAKIRGGTAKSVSPTGRFWLAAPNVPRIYSYEYDKIDNYLLRPTIYDFDSKGIHLIRILAGNKGEWTERGLQIINPVGFDLTSNTELLELKGIYLNDFLTLEQFKPLFNKPSHVTMRELSGSIKLLKRREDNRELHALEVALYRRFAEPFSALVMALIGIPLGLGFGKRSAVSALAFSLGIGVSFWGITSSFLHLGYGGTISPILAAWSSTLIYAASGLYLLFRART